VAFVGMPIMNIIHILVKQRAVGRNSKSVRLEVTLARRRELMFSVKHAPIIPMNVATSKSRPSGASDVSSVCNGLLGRRHELGCQFPQNRIFSDDSINHSYLEAFWQ
jgi:hypothetical protein